MSTEQAPGPRGLLAVRLEVAAAASGPRRRAAVTEVTLAHLAELWDGLDADGAALGAVGSLGRGDTGPLSDLDLLLVHDRDLEVADLADRLWYPLWDAGLGVDHSVRSLAQCRQVASQDLAAAVGMLDLRCVAGDAELAAQAQQAVLADWRRAARRRLPELERSVAARRARFGVLATLTEPELKEARGGIRDAVVVHALAASWLTDRPHGAFDDAYEYLLDVRDALHLVTRRTTNRLLAADAEAVAQMLGLGTSALLAGIAEAGREVAQGLEVTLRRARQALDRRPVRPIVRRGRTLPPRLHPVGKGLVLHRGEVVLAPGARPGPELAVRAAAAAVTWPLSPITVSGLLAVGPMREPWPPAVRADLLAVLSGGRAQIPVWEALLLELMPRWLPEWQAIHNLPQAPPHRHTVDRHLVQTVSELASSDPVLLLAAWLHDLGKGRPDHPKAGAELVPGVLERLGFDLPDVAVLVRHHLTMAVLATSRDHEGAVTELLDAVAWRPDLLTRLRALTEADSVATGVWTSWRAGLVDRLYRRALARLES